MTTATNNHAPAVASTPGQRSRGHAATTSTPHPRGKLATVQHAHMAAKDKPGTVPVKVAQRNAGRA
jgi:hypothetical protein